MVIGHGIGMGLIPLRSHLPRLISSMRGCCRQVQGKIGLRLTRSAFARLSAQPNLGSMQRANGGYANKVILQSLSTAPVIKMSKKRIRHSNRQRLIISMGRIVWENQYTRKPETGTRKVVPNVLQSLTKESTLLCHPPQITPP